MFYRSLPFFKPNSKKIWNSVELRNETKRKSNVKSLHFVPVPLLYYFCTAFGPEVDSILDGPL